MAIKSFFKKGQIVQLLISSLNSKGEGISKDLGPCVFINRTAPGDHIEAEIFDVRKDFARGHLIKLIESSPERTEPPCKLFKVCGGCQLQHLNYQYQLKVKHDIICQAMEHIGKLDPSSVLPVLPAISALAYRSKVQFPVASPNNSSRILAGYYQQNSHQLVNIKHCPVQPEPLDRVLSAAKQACHEECISAYNEITHSGLLRHITARCTSSNNPVLVTLVVNARPQELPLDKLRLAAGKIMHKVPEVKGVCLNFNPLAGNRIFGETTICLVGESFIEDRLSTRQINYPAQFKQCLHFQDEADFRPPVPYAGAPREGIRFRLSPTSFFQVNPLMSIELLDVVFNAVIENNPHPDLIPDLIVDAYAGVGAIALWLASIARQVIAIEENPTAIEDGQVNLELNQITNVSFCSGTVEKHMAALRQQSIKPEVLILDPPRKGLSLEVLSSTLALSCPLIIYISCNPATLARDLAALTQGGYKIKSIQPLDMFPHTYHVESVAILHWQES